MDRGGAGGRRRTLRAALGLALLSLLASCAGVDTYRRSRVADLADAFPFSFGWGFGLSVSMKATNLVQLGLGPIPSRMDRWGYEDRTFYGTWREFQTGLPWAPWIEGSHVLPEWEGELSWTRGLPLLYRWQTMRDAPAAEGQYTQEWEPELTSWGRHPPVCREERGGLLLPSRRRWVAFVDLRSEAGDPDPLDAVGSPLRATLWEARRPGGAAPRAWDLFELDANLLLVGARFGVRPGEFLDFVVGLVGLDPLGDDLPRAEVATPIERGGADS